MLRLIPLSLMTVLMLSGCAKEESPSGSSANGASATWLLASEPEGALSVSDARATVKEGDTVAVRGRIGGRREVLTPGSAVFTLIDLGLPHCGENPDDACQTPWDYCCEAQETITANAATVQIVDQAGQGVSGDLRTAGLSELDEVIVVGTVGPRPNDSVLTIRATGVFIAAHGG